MSTSDLAAHWPASHVSEIPDKGDFKTLQIGESPALIVHGDDDKIRVFYDPRES